MQLPIQPPHQFKHQLNKVSLSNGTIESCFRIIFSGKLQISEGVVGDWDDDLLKSVLKTGVAC